MSEPMTVLDATIADLAIAVDLCDSEPDGDRCLSVPTVRVRELLDKIESLRAELASLRGESTGTEWGVRWRAGDEFMEPDEDTARGIARAVTGAVLVKRRGPGPWVVAE